MSADQTPARSGRELTERARQEYHRCIPCGAGWRSPDRETIERHLQICGPIVSAGEVERLRAITQRTRRVSDGHQVADCPICQKRICKEAGG